MSSRKIRRARLACLAFRDQPAPAGGRRKANLRSDSSRIHAGIPGVDDEIVTTQGLPRWVPKAGSTAAEPPFRAPPAGFPPNLVVILLLTRST